MKVINMIGAPCSGKSTASAQLFAKLKMKHINCELVTEYAKDLTWEQRYNILKNQVYILAKQYNRLERLRDKVDYVITDSPLILSLIYNQDLKNLDNLTLELFNKFDNINLFLPIKQYVGIGRNESYEEAVKIEEKILTMLKEYKISYSIMVNNVS